MCREIKEFMIKGARMKDPQTQKDNKAVQDELKRQEDLLNEIIKEMDIDGDGKVSKKEFCDAYIK